MLQKGKPGLIDCLVLQWGAHACLLMMLECFGSNMSETNGEKQPVTSEVIQDVLGRIRSHEEVFILFELVESVSLTVMSLYLEEKHHHLRQRIHGHAVHRPIPCYSGQEKKNPTCGFCLQWECVQSAFTPGSFDSP